VDTPARDALAGFLRDEIRVELAGELERLSELAERVAAVEAMLTHEPDDSERHRV
jgi:hypothetical protein